MDNENVVLPAEMPAENETSTEENIVFRTADQDFDDADEAELEEETAE